MRLFPLGVVITIAKGKEQRLRFTDDQVIQLHLVPRQDGIIPVRADGHAAHILRRGRALAGQIAAFHIQRLAGLRRVQVIVYVQRRISNQRRAPRSAQIAQHGGQRGGGNISLLIVVFQRRIQIFTQPLADLRLLLLQKRARVVPTQHQHSLGADVLQLPNLGEYILQADGLQGIQADHHLAQLAEAQRARGGAAQRGQGVRPIHAGGAQRQVFLPAAIILTRSGFSRVIGRLDGDNHAVLGHIHAHGDDHQA